MYEIVFENDMFWISKNSKIIRELGGFIDPVTPKIILKELGDENGQAND